MVQPRLGPLLSERDLVTTFNQQDDSPASTPLYDQTGYAPPLASDLATPASSDDSSGKADAAKEQAGKVAGDAQDATKHVAGVTKDQAAQVASEAKSQAKDLYAQATSELKEQAGTQQQKVADGLRSVSDELSSMAENGSGLAGELVRNLSGRAGSVAGWLDGRDPGSLLSEVKSYAARKPGTFIAIAAGAGLLAGRLTKALAAEAKNDTGSSAANTPAVSPPSAGYTPTASSVTPVPAASEYDEYAQGRPFDEIVTGDPDASRPLGEQR